MPSWDPRCTEVPRTGRRGLAHCCAHLAAAITAGPVSTWRVLHDSATAATPAAALRLGSPGSVAPGRGLLHLVGPPPHRRYPRRTLRPAPRPLLPGPAARPRTRRGPPRRPHTLPRQRPPRHHRRPEPPAVVHPSPRCLRPARPPAPALGRGLPRRPDRPGASLVPRRPVPHHPAQHLTPPAPR